MQLDIADSECLAVFVFDSAKMKADGIHWKAFRPDDRGERSFFRIDDLDYAAIAAIGNEVAAERNQTLHGWGVLRAKKVRSITPLQLKSDEPPDRHGVIIGWPPESQDERAAAIAMARIAGTVRYPN
ncbi:MAG: hypothetical protein ACLPV8_01980 [Steroidobacteraceae bacterium]